MKVIGLTGSIGMGKSTTAGLFAAHGDAVWDADSEVHRRYEGAAVLPVSQLFPGVVGDGGIDRQKLSAAVIGKREALRALEAVVHPMVRAAELEFLEDARAVGAKIAVLDIPLLLETPRRQALDAVVVVSAPAEVQRERVMARAGMTAEKFEAIRAKQMPDALKRAKADYVIDTGAGIESAAQQVAAVREALLATR